MMLERLFISMFPTRELGRVTQLLAIVAYTSTDVNEESIPRREEKLLSERLLH